MAPEIERAHRKPLPSTGVAGGGAARQSPERGRMNDPTNNIALTLSRDEALVLFEFLSRFSDEEELRIEDQAENRVLWHLCCILEQQLVEPFREDYADCLARARHAVRDPDPEQAG